MLVAPLDTAPIEGFAFAGANEGASGAAVVLELTRVLAESPLPYTLQVVFLEGDRLRPDKKYGSEILLAALKELERLGRLRAVIYVGSVGDRDLKIARDADSNRRLRNAVFAMAPSVGHADAFPQRVPFVRSASGHALFSDLGLPALLINDPTFGSGDAPGLLWRTEQDTPAECSPESLEAVGDVLLGALESEMQRWARIDDLRGHEVAATTDPGSTSAAPAAPMELPAAEGAAPVSEEAAP